MNPQVAAVAGPGWPGGPLILQLAAPLRSAQPTVAGLERQVRRVGGLAVVGTGVLGFVAAGVALRPLRRLRAATEQVTTDHDLSLRVPAGRGPTGVTAVARSMNAMLAALEASAATTAAALAASRSFAADAGHELRTPIAVIRTNLEVLARNPGMTGADRDALLAEVEREQARLLRTLDGLQMLARGDLGAAHLPVEPVDVADLVGVAVHDAARLWPAAEFAFTAPGIEVVVHGWAEGLRVLVGNLLRNAVLHAADPRGRVRVAVAVQQESDGVLLVVDDDGPGIPLAEREHVLGRFARGTGGAATGSGLGLALAAQQARLHGGRLESHDSPLGGTRVLAALATS